MYKVGTFLRDAQGDTISFVSPYKVRTGLDINTKVILILNNNQLMHSQYNIY